MSYDILYFPLGANAMGGAERSIAYLCAAMQKKGKRVCILAERALQDTAYPQFLREQGIEVHWVEWAPEQGFFHNIKEAFRVFRKYPAKVIQFNISWRRGMWVIPIEENRGQTTISGLNQVGERFSMPRRARLSLPKAIGSTTIFPMMPPATSPYIIQEHRSTNSHPDQLNIPH